MSHVLAIVLHRLHYSNASGLLGIFTYLTVVVPHSVSFRQQVYPRSQHILQSPSRHHTLLFSTAALLNMDAFEALSLEDAIVSGTQAQTVASPANRPDYFRFEDLPGEIRNKIYAELLCTFDSPSVLPELLQSFHVLKRKYDIDGVRTLAQHNDPAILRTSQAIYREASHFMQTANVFIKVETNLPIEKLCEYLAVYQLRVISQRSECRNLRRCCARVCNQSRQRCCWNIIVPIRDLGQRSIITPESSARSLVSLLLTSPSVEPNIPKFPYTKS